MAANLADQTCVPCRGGIPPLEASAAKQLLAQAPSWTLADDARRIERTFRFPNFKEAMELVTKIGDLAEAEGHHPDIHFGWGYATISMHTHKIKGLHENDFIMAAKIDRLAEAVASR
jgi:4a-hydroxytetrahydrobiopterin dehydratase